MKIAVFGATGGTGQQTVQQALDQGYEVKALARDPHKLSVTSEKLQIVQGDVLDSQTVDQVIDGVEGVLVTLGSRPDTKPTVLTEGTAIIINAMKNHGVKRLIVESSYPMSGDSSGMGYLKAAGMDDEQIAGFQPMLDDKVGQENNVRESGLDWIIVRPLGLTDGDRTGQYRAGEKLDVKPGDSISRADVTDFMLNSVKDNKWLHKIVTVAY